MRYFLIARRDRLYALITRWRIHRQDGRCGAGLRIRGGLPHILNKGCLKLGDMVRIRNEPAAVRLRTAAGGEIILGNEVSLNTGVILFSAASIQVGDATRIGDNTSLFDTSFHAVHEGHQTRARPIRIGRNVWIGRNAIILPGITIGDHSVIAAGSVVFDDVPARQVWRGNPAMFVKHVRATDNFKRI